MAKAKEQAKQDDFGDNIRLDGLAQKVMQISGGIGALGLAASLGMGFTGDRKAFMHSYLVAFAFVLSLGIGALWWVTLQHLVNAKWSIVVRRVGELLSSNMPLIALLSLPIVIPTLMGDSTLYVWADHAKLQTDPALHHKAAYFGREFFVIRLVIYFGFWVLLGRFWFKQSVVQDKGGSPELPTRLQRFSAPGMILLAFTLTFAAFDFLMSLEPAWGSTIFGVYFFAGAVVSFHALLALVLMWLQQRGRMVQSVTVEHYHDIGKMMFAFTAFWAYIAFSQFMLIWYANLPEETEFFHLRAHGEWLSISYAIITLNFVIPFFGMMSRYMKRNKKWLAFWCFWVLAVHWLDMFWLVKPHLHTENVPFNVLDVTCLVGVLGLFIASTAYNAQKVNLVPIKDPRLARSLAFENF